jgi:hypothetical protein
MHFTSKKKGKHLLARTLPESSEKEKNGEGIKGHF